MAVICVTVEQETELSQFSAAFRLETVEARRRPWAINTRREIERWCIAPFPKV